MLEIKNLSILIGSRYFIKDLSFSLNKRDKLAIIGEEGNGKSTLLKAILGTCDYATINGEIYKKNNRIGYLEQSMNEQHLKKSVYSFLFKNKEDYYNKITKLYKYLSVLKLKENLLEQSMDTLSGGEKIKIGILKLLLEEYDILLLDEPTNDLDLDTLIWLEQFINNIDIPIMYISHDETLLSHTANMILHLEQLKNKTDCRHTILKIDYHTYIENRLRKMDKQTQVAKAEKREFQKKQAKLNQIMQKVEYRQNTISRSDPHGGKVLKVKMRSLKSQEKRLDHAILTEIPDVEESIYFAFQPVFIPKTKVILKWENRVLKIPNTILSNLINLEVIGNEHICIIGKNGVGKSTLIKKFIVN